MRILPILPIIIPFVTALVTLFFRKNIKIQGKAAVLGAAALFIASLILLQVVRTQGIQVIQLGNWSAPFGISVVIDLFSALMIVVAGLMGLLVAVYSLGTIDPDRVRYSYYPLLHFLLMGVCGCFSTGDIFNLYVWFEVMLLSSFVLLTLGGERPQLEGAIKYVTLNLVSSVIFLTAVGILYAVAGTLNMADLAVLLKTDVPRGMVTTISMLFLIAFGIKAAIFPLFFWLPASYHTPPVAITAIFSGLLTKVGVYSMIRVFTLIFTDDTEFTHHVILVLGGLTMVTGVLGAVAQNEMRRLLSFHIVSQIGYLLMGLGIFTPLALAGAIFFMVHVIVAKSALFLVSGAVYRIKGTYQLEKLGGIYSGYPFLSGLFLVAAFSLAGLPPFSGFFGKLALVRAGLENQNYVIVAVALGVGMLTLFSMTKIWAMAFWKADFQLASGGAPQKNVRLGFSLLGPIVVLSGLTILLGLLAEPLFIYSEEAARQLLNPGEYIEAVMGVYP